MVSTILSYLLVVLYNILKKHEYKFCFSRKEAGVTPKLLKRVAREGEEMNEKEEGWYWSALKPFLKRFFLFLGYVSNVAI